MIKFFFKTNIAKNIIRFINKILKRDIKIIGNYSSWLEAKNDSLGYDHKIIFDKSKESFLKVINGTAKYERDSVPFYSDDVNYPLIKLLNSIHDKRKKILNVLDFGESFGSTYFQNLTFLKNQNKFNWFIVEQKHIVNYIKHFKLNKNLFFFFGNNYLKKNIDLVLFSSVLQYLSDSFYHINLLLKKKIKNFFDIKNPVSN